MRLIACATAAFLGAALAPATCFAGRQLADEARCSKQQFVAGEWIHGCVGTMKGFREHPDPNAYAEMMYRANGTLTFQAQVDGVFFACAFPPGYDAQYYASVLSNVQNGRFVIGSRGGICDMVGATITYGSRWAPP